MLIFYTLVTDKKQLYIKIRIYTYFNLKITVFL